MATRGPVSPEHGGEGSGHDEERQENEEDGLEPLGPGAIGPPDLERATAAEHIDPDADEQPPRAADHEQGQRVASQVGDQERERQLSESDQDAREAYQLPGCNCRAYRSAAVATGGHARWTVEDHIDSVVPGVSLTLWRGVSRPVRTSR